MIPQNLDNWIIALSIWDIIAKGFALWHAAKKNQRNWYIALLIVNSAGILPVIYIKFFQ
jgi:hypothetical protein